ncbi:hypothetical protein [Pedobacter sp. L105]|uniref:hypothetical protein n=1 Tax=Pedobacter sp. L105 TaxID=1641871 RepID=UPI00131C7163|nr:hypothetical protein [Pedobacter sp. L105]
MGNNVLFNFLKLAYSPISNYDFTVIKDDPIIKNYINTSSLYIIAQRPVLTFENFDINPNDQFNPFITFVIRQKGSDSELQCKFPLFQDKLMNSQHQGMNIAVNYIYPETEGQDKLPFHSVANFVIASLDGEFYWFSPEKLIYHFLRDAVDVEIIGDISEFLKYQIHYIGKATEQDVIKRLNGHSSLQEILSREEPLKYGSLPRDEIVILFLCFEDNIVMNSFGPEDNLKPAVDILMGKGQIPESTIYLDAEKALISALKPKYNRQLYKNYPKSKDGLDSFNLDYYSYTFIDPITLLYNDGVIKGGYDFFDGDIFTITNGNFELNIK